MNVSFPHNSFSVDPSTEMFTDSYHSPSFSHLSLDMFQKTGPFHLPSRCEEICSLMAFKTGSADNKKKGEVRKTLRSPVPTSVDASFASAAAHCRCAKVPTVPVTLTSICRQLDTISPTAAYSHWMGSPQSQWSLNAIQGSGLELCFEFVCYCILCSQLLCKKNPLSLNWILEGLYWRNAHRNTLLPMCKSFYYQAN